jgi:hypothetical protein
MQRSTLHILLVKSVKEAIIKGEIQGGCLVFQTLQVYLKLL